MWDGVGFHHCRRRVLGRLGMLTDPHAIETPPLQGKVLQ